MPTFFGIELSDKSGTTGGIRYINLDSICRVDYVNPTNERQAGEMDVFLNDGFTFKADGKLAEQISLSLLKHLENPDDQ
jgi:hypothetical protein